MTKKTKKPSPLKGKKLSEETKAKISKAMKLVERGPLSEETKAKISQSMQGKNSGKDHYKWKPFTLVVTLPCGNVKRYDFKGRTPIASCSKRFKLGRGDVLYRLRQGEEWTIKKRTFNTKHTFKIGTKVTMEEL